ncbi:unnamed protein product [Cuscuta campestris]|uniref:AAA+ ATPase domain-containing protein n=1 Tax=Cuscuta campestris TaxID=132261 RepID=A0A484M4J4_9ASTE|nr:unnamed protein product [Cuscuta campestris]
MVAGMEELWGKMGSGMVTLLVLWATFDRYFPYELRDWLKKYVRKWRSAVDPYVHITFPEYPGAGFHRSRAYQSIERYLSANSSAQAKRLKADDDAVDSPAPVLGLDYHEEVTDTFSGNTAAAADEEEERRFKVWWTSCRDEPKRQNAASFYGGGGGEADGRRYFTLKFHERYRDVVTGAYLRHVLDTGKAINVRDRTRKLYTNWQINGRSSWIQVAFQHPATFETLAMDPRKKREIVEDLATFKDSKEYYARTGRAWKRGYLLYGPPGTGKSSMVAAMANLLEYDVYDLELTAVNDNTALRKLLIDTSGRSVIVIEDIDCSLDLTGQRKGRNNQQVQEEDDDDEEEKMKMKKKKSEVSLSGLLNFIDGLWSAIGGERLIVFTTNFKEKLDPALIRSGRMDKHIELSYCGFEAFKVLARNYLGVEHHPLFPVIGRLLAEANMTPSDVAENLMPKSPREDGGACLQRLVAALEGGDARLKADEIAVVSESNTPCFDLQK